MYLKPKTKFLLNLIIAFISLFCINGNIFSNADLKTELLKKIDSGIPQWMLNQISENLLFAPKAITSKMIKKTLEQDKMCLILFKIKDGKIEREYNPVTTLQQQIDVSEPIAKVLEELSSYVKLPNVEFVYSIDDAPSSWPNMSQLKPRPTTRYEIPVFGPCKHINDINVLLIPDAQTIALILGTFKQEIELGISKYPWHVKKNKAFWRGGTTGGLYEPYDYHTYPRVKLVKLSIAHPYLLDARFNRIWEIPENYIENFDQLTTTENVSISEHLQYKYQILIDGNSAPWSRAYWQYHCNSVVFKQNSNFIMWHNDLFKPWMHYIPFDRDCVDLIDAIEWVIEHDKEAKKIVKNANKTALECLKYSDILLYFYAAITEYAKLLPYQN